MHMCILSWKPGYVAIGLAGRARSDQIRPYCLYRASNVEVGLEIMHPEQDSCSFRRVAPDVKASLSLISNICDHHDQTLKAALVLSAA